MIGRVHYRSGKAGANMTGLIRYLVGPGRTNEHTDPHVLAGSGSLAVEFAGNEWDSDKAVQLAWLVDGAWREARQSAGLPTDVPGGTPMPQGPGAARADHVFHVSLSLRDDEGVLPDEKWAAIAKDYVTAMGFTAESGKAECQWVAIRHGLSKKGNDHVHIAVSLVREDGTRVSEWQSKSRTRKAVDAIEVKYGLRPARDSNTERGLPGHNGAEAAKADRLDRAEPAPEELARRVRAVAFASQDEADFVRTAREHGLLMRPRFAAGGTVQGYSVALDAEPGAEPVWYGGGRLEKTLALPSLRQRWGSDVGEQQAAVAQWRQANDRWGAEAPADHRSPPDGGQAAPAPADEANLPVEAAKDVARLNRALAEVDPMDRLAWQAAAREGAGLLALWSRSVEGDQPGPLAQASDALARAAQPRRGDLAGGGGRLMSARHVRLLARASSRNTATGWIAVMRQLDATMHAIRAAHLARGELIRARELSNRLGPGLEPVRRDVAARPANTGAAQSDTTRRPQAASGGPRDERMADRPHGRVPTTGPRRAHTKAAAAEEARRQRMSDAVRSAWPEQAAQAVVSSTAFGAVAFQLEKLEREGRDPVEVLRTVGADAVTASTAREPAAVLALRLSRMRRTDDSRSGAAAPRSIGPTVSGRSATPASRDQDDRGR